MPHEPAGRPQAPGEARDGVVALFSGGVASWAATRRYADRHGTAGLTLVRLVTHGDKRAEHHMGNTHLWHATFSPADGFKLLYHDLSAVDAAKADHLPAR